MYSYRVKPKNKNWIIAFCFMFAAAAALWIASAYGLWLRAVLQALMMTFVLMGVLIIERYGLSTFEYVISGSSADYDFVVMKSIGSRSKVVCRMSLSAARSLIKIKKGGKHPSGIGRIYDYAGTLFPSEYWLLSFSDDDSTVLKIEPDAELLKLISRLTGIDCGC